MDSIGQMLRCERERQKRSLSEIATQTCIGTMYLDAIEQDKLSVLPGFFFYKNFVKQYASALGIESPELDAEIAKAEPKMEPDLVPAAVKKSTVSGRAIGISAAAMLVVIVAAGASYSLFHRKEKTVPVALPTYTAKAEPVKQAAVEPPPVEAAASEAPARHLLNLLAREKTWVSLKSDGKTVFRGTLAARESKEIDLADNGKLTTGNAAALDVTLNGRPLGRLGPRGQVRTILFAQGTAQILGGRL